jgi:hypothetical protein
MTSGSSGGGDEQTPRLDPAAITQLALPSHVTVWADSRWRRGWLIARSHEPGGWIGRVQYVDDNGREITTWIAAEQITTAESWLTDT